MIATKLIYSFLDFVINRIVVTPPTTTRDKTKTAPTQRQALTQTKTGETLTTCKVTGKATVERVVTETEKITHEWEDLKVAKTKSAPAGGPPTQAQVEALGLNYAQYMLYRGSWAMGKSISQVVELHSGEKGHSRSTVKPYRAAYTKLEVVTPKSDTKTTQK